MAIFDAARERMATEGRLHEYAMVRESWEYIDRRNREEKYGYCFPISKTTVLNVRSVY
jgi:hypothetical protein